ncbi:MAG: aspartate--tRNA ligase [Candidatus Woesearchaeota archaeon]
MYMRSHTCGDLRAKHEKSEVKLSGWVDSRRDHGGVIFIDLRDRYGITQVVFDPKKDPIAHKMAETLRREDVIQVTGVVSLRKPGMANPKIATGEIEVYVNSLNILSRADTPPIEIDDRIELNEEIRLKYRYLDLRRPRMQKNLILRHKVVKSVRDFLDKHGFLEIETPMLARSTPEGARDYLVPSRVNPGKFYALPQSPQIFKQLLMISGLDRYAQIVRCFRDEDLRADRQPEFTQIDIEMSFVREKDIMHIIEQMVQHVWKDVLSVELKTPFPVLTYAEAMEKYGSDKPDLRYGLELVDITDIAIDSDFEVFKSAISAGGKVKGINAKGFGYFSRKDLDELIDFVKIHKAKGLAWMKMLDNGLESSIVKFFNESVQKRLISKMNASNGDILLFVADKDINLVNKSLGALRVELGKRLANPPKPDNYQFVWVVDFPLLEFSEEEQRYVAMHHPFTSPKDEDLHLLKSEPEKVRAKAYDLTLNGIELGGGSIRIHSQSVQEQVFNVLGITQTDAKSKFGFFLEALRYGTPPHGGIAFGLDRMVMLIAGENSIREVIAFPKNKDAVSLMDNCPNDVDEKQLKELGLKIEVKK